MSEAAGKRKRTTQAELKLRRQAFVDAFLGEARFNATKAARIAGYAAPGSEGHRLLKNAEIKEEISIRLADMTMSRDQVLVELRETALADMSDFISFFEVFEQVMVKKPVRAILDELRERIQFEDQFAARAKLAGEELTNHNAAVASMQREALRLEMKLEWDPDATQQVLTTVSHMQSRLDLKKAEERGKLHLIHSYNNDTGRIELVNKDKALELIGKHHALFIDKVEHGGNVVATITSEEMVKARNDAREWEIKMFGKAAS